MVEFIGRVSKPNSPTLDDPIMQSSHGGFSSFPKKSNCMCVTSARYDSLFQNPSLLCLDLVSKECQVLIV